MKATPAPKQFIDEQAVKQANLKVSRVKVTLGHSVLSQQIGLV